MYDYHERNKIKVIYTTGTVYLIQQLLRSLNYSYAHMRKESLSFRFRNADVYNV